MQKKIEKDVIKQESKVKWYRDKNKEERDDYGRQSRER
jgi:hypothetical protein